MSGDGVSNAVPEGPALLAHMTRSLVRTGGVAPEAAAIELAGDAVAWRCDRDAQPIPAALREPPALHPDRSRGLPAEMFQVQRAWLDHADADQLSSYIPNLVRALDGDLEHISSEPIAEVVVAALTANVRPQERRSVVLYDPVCGTAGMLSRAAQELRTLGARVEVSGQDMNAPSAFLAGCAVTVGGWPGAVKTGDCLIADADPQLRFDYATAEPPFGLDWHRVSEAVHERREAGMFPGGLPPQSDGTLLFVQLLIGKMRSPSDGGGRAVVLVAPAALQDRGGDSIRRWLLQEDFLEAVIGLPEGISPATGIRLNALVLTNRRPQPRRGQIQLVDLRGAFEDRRGSRLSKRRLRPDAISSLRQALSTIKNGPISRTVTAERFMQRTVTVVTGAAGGPQREWRMALSLADEPHQFVARHVPVPPSRVTDVGFAGACRIGVYEILNRDARQVKAWVRDRGWTATRLAAVADNPAYVPPTSSDDRSGAIAALPPGPLVMLPMDSAHPVVYGDPAAGPPDRRFIAFACAEEIQPEFLTGYLNSSTGKIARRAALEPLGGMASRTISRAAADPFLAALVIPSPDGATQQRLADADSAVRSAVSLATRTADELWRSPERSTELVRQVAPTPQPQTLANWAHELPYPLATALWACETQRLNPHAANSQLFHFWEATAAFTGTVLLSALDQDESLRETEMDSLRTTLAKANLSMQRATLGAWLIITQRLGRRFRDMLDSQDPDERARVDALFAGAPEQLIRALCSGELSALLERVIQRRNNWSGHGGATTVQVLAERNAWLIEQIQTLRWLMDGTWTDAPLVRAGSATYEDGVFIHNVERVMGLNTPFLTQTVTVGAAMNRGQLYVVTDGAQRGLRIEPFVQLRDSPSSAQFGCYFYNRLEGDEARLVSYHLGHDGEVLERSPGLASLVAGFDAAAPL